MDKLELNRIAFIGRTFREYSAIFGLDEKTLSRGPVLDCPAGASSFTAEARGKGFDVTACDLLYGIPEGELLRKANDDTDYALSQAYKVIELYDWGFYGGVEGHRKERERALALFSEDYPGGSAEGRYVRSELPKLPFEDNRFALVLSGHFLFLYSDRLTHDFHVACLREMLRVGGEVRVFPIFGLDARPYRRLNELISELGRHGYPAELVKVPFEFMKGGDRMLRITHETK